ncbi:hypothetical protein Krac_1215 [Ktedonobacter racemifer DSM 44963]|uniref:Uncharacterized protein n=1 Tax=Ktedonobacter racemifer DSM 44963 TaxID=485913 RepID=D6U6I9_KTERA|nr:hypothetical protein Krac_1215 [Ktedonobacter racemifer DSM 44963]
MPAAFLPLLLSALNCRVEDSAFEDLYVLPTVFLSEWLLAKSKFLELFSISLDYL